MVLVLVQAMEVLVDKVRLLDLQYIMLEEAVEEGYLGGVPPLDQVEMGVVALGGLQEVHRVLMEHMTQEEEEVVLQTIIHLQIIRMGGLV
jgi:hypothetical protein